MKTLELTNLPSPVLLVWGLPEDAEVEETDFNVRENKYVRYWLSGKDYLEDFPEGATGNWQLIGKLSELTEEQAKGLVENIEIPMFPDEVCFRDYNVTGFRGLDTALHSFHSAVTASGQESKTLPPNTLIFRKA